MIDLSKSLESIKNNIVFLSAICYGLGLTYNFVYYLMFDIPIFYYLSLNDLLYYPIVILLTIVTMILIYDLYFEHSTRIARYFYRKFPQELLDKAIKITRYFILIGGWIICLYFTNHLLFGNLYLSIIVFVFPFAYIAYKTFNIEDYKDLDNLKNKITIGILVIVQFVVIISMPISSGNTNTYVKFCYNDLDIDTSIAKDEIYIGETTTHLFLYNIKKEESSVFEKSEIKFLKYK